jgi:signal transduction histidine kinase
MADIGTPCLRSLLGEQDLTELQQALSLLVGTAVYFGGPEGEPLLQGTYPRPQHTLPISINDQVSAYVMLQELEAVKIPALAMVVNLIARQATAAYQNKILSQQMTHLSIGVTQAHEEERHRISRELHDEITQGLSSINLGLGLVMMDIEKDTALHGSLEQLQSQATELTREVRAISQDLRPPALDSFGLVPSLRQHIKRYGQQKAAPPVTFQVQGESYRQSADIELAVFRVVQEALSNIYKHACASTINVTLMFAEEGLVVDVVDDGRGFVVGEDLNVLASEGHLGLIGMQERMAAIGGRWRVVSAVGKGCRVWAACPRVKEELKEEHHDGT